MKRVFCKEFLRDLIDRLRKNALSLCVAESCTGGFLSYLITSVKGVSDVYKGGVMTYSIESKKRILRVQDFIFKDYSVYSQQCVESMARGAMQVFNADIAIATSGLASEDSSENNFLRLKAGVAFTCVMIKDEPHFLCQNYLDKNYLDKKCLDENCLNIIDSREFIQKQVSIESLLFLDEQINSILFC